MNRRIKRAAKVVIVGVYPILSLLNAFQVMANGLELGDEARFDPSPPYLTDIIFVSIFFILAGVVLLWGWDFQERKRKSIILSTMVFLVSGFVFGNSIYIKRKLNNYHTEIAVSVNSIRTFQEAYYVEHDTYAKDLDGLQRLGLEMPTGIYVKFLKADSRNYECEVKREGFDFAYFSGGNLHTDHWIPLTAEGISDLRKFERSRNK